MLLGEEQIVFFRVYSTPEGQYEGGGKGLRIPEMYLRKTIPRDLNCGSLWVLERIFMRSAKGPFRRALGYCCMCVCVCVCTCARMRYWVLVM